MVDSNGMLSETGWQKLLPVCDGVMLDLKHGTARVIGSLPAAITR